MIGSVLALAVAGGLSHLLPAYAALGLLVTLLLVLVISWSSPSFVNGMRPHADSSRTSRPDRRTEGQGNPRPVVTS